MSVQSTTAVAYRREFSVDRSLDFSVGTRKSTMSFAYSAEIIQNTEAQSNGQCSTLAALGKFCCGTPSCSCTAQSSTLV